MVGAIAVLALLGSLAACGGSKSSGGDSTSSGGGSSESGYCDRIRAYQEESNQIEAVLSTSDPAALKTAFEAMQRLAADLEDNPPAEIADDVRIGGQIIDKTVELLAKFDYDIMKAAGAPEFAELDKQMSDPTAQAASDRLERWAEEKCGIAPDSGS